MSDITSVSGSGSSSLAALLSTKRPRTEASTPEADAGDFASALCSFSNESLAKLSETGHAGLQLLESGVDHTVEGIQDLGQGMVHLAEQGLDAVVDVAHAVESAASGIAHTVESAASGVAELWDDTVDAASEVAGAVTDGAEVVIDLVGAGARNVASYAALGHSTASALLREWV